MRIPSPLFMLPCFVAACGGRATDPVPPSPPASLGAGDHSLSLMVAGTTRRFLVHVPPGAPTARAVVMAFHGGGGNAAQYKSLTAFDAHADRYGYVVVYPDGTGTGANSWNAGGCCSTALATNALDVAFGRAIVGDLLSRGVLDPARLYVTGHSNGAMMAHRFAAEASDLVAAAAPYAGAPYFSASTFAPAQPVPILHIHSVDDPLALFEGGVSGEGTLKTPVLTQLGFWALRNGCGGPVTEADSIVGAAGSGNAGQTAAWVRWSGCGATTPVVLRRLTGVGHAWPGITMTPTLIAQLGPGTTLIDIESEIWDFVSRFSR